MYDFKVDFTILDESTRMIEGIATAPVMDREKEIILSEAIQKALPDYLKLPVLHYNHTERPIGMVTEARIVESGGLYVKAFIKDTKDADDVWERITKGEINAFSIYGRRRQGSSECKLHPNSRTSPCITKSIYLDSITLCGDNKVNPATHFNIIKSIIEENINTKELNIMASDELKSEDDISKGCGVKPPIEKMETESEEDEKTESIEELIEEVSALKEIVNKLVESDKKVHNTMEKGEMESNEQLVDENIKVKGEELTAPVTKAEIVESPEVFSKADVIQEISKATTEIYKAFEAKINELKSELETVKNETIMKGGNVVVIKGDEVKEAPLSNHGALDKFLKR